MLGTKTHRAGLFVWTVLFASVPFSLDAAERLYQLARPFERPTGAPKASDVIMRSLRLHPRDANDPHDTMEAIRRFHVNRLAWAYITDREFIAQVKKRGVVFGGAAAAPSYVPDGKADDWFERVVIVNLSGEPIIAPWKRTWNRTLWGCMNNPELERGYVEYLKRYIDVGADVMQRDEPGGNLNAVRWGGCFCDYCVEGFRNYLKENTSRSERDHLGIRNVETFDYREYLKQVDAPVGDAFGPWNGGRLKDLFVEFQTQATIAFHRRTRLAIDRYAGRHVPVSCNNGGKRWSDIELCFDWAFGELAYGDATATRLYTILDEARRRGRLQVLTMPKKGDTKNPEEWERRTRRTVAMTYACGGWCMVPWDVYMPRDAPRYFGEPQQYADLFGFVRAAQQYLDGYELATATGHGVPRAQSESCTAVRITGGDRVAAVIRAVPGDPQAPIVVHFVNWADTPQQVSLALDTRQFFGGERPQLRWLSPKAYAANEHDRAEEAGDYRALIDERAIPASDAASITLPPVDVWALLIVEAVK